MASMQAGPVVRHEARMKTIRRRANELIATFRNGNRKEVASELVDMAADEAVLVTLLLGKGLRKDEWDVLWQLVENRHWERFQKELDAADHMDEATLARDRAGAVDWKAEALAGWETARALATAHGADVPRAQAETVLARLRRP